MNIEEKLQNILLEGLRNGVFMGASAACTLENKTYLCAVGASAEKGGLAIRTDHLFDCASVTKSIPTGILAVQCIAKGMISLEEPILPYFPDLRVPFKEKITLKHLLTHTLDYRFSLSSYKEASPSEIWEKLMTHPMVDPPGAKYLYCNSTSIVLGKLVERLSKKSLDQLAEEWIFKPLELKRIGFRPLERFRREEIIPTEKDSWRGRVIRGEVHDESAWRMNEEGVVGSAGLFSTASDLARIMDDLNLCLKGEGILLPKQFCQLMFANHLQLPGLETCLGWERNSSRFMGDFKSESIVGKTGFTGSHVILDCESSVSGVLLSNYTWPIRKRNSDLINEFRTLFNNFLWEHS